MAMINSLLPSILRPPSRSAPRCSGRPVQASSAGAGGESARNRAELAGIFRCSSGCAGYSSRTKSRKNPPTFIRRRKVPWRFSRSGDRSPAHRPFLGQGTLPSPTTGCRIRFPESLLMLSRKKFTSSDGLSKNRCGERFDRAGCRLDLAAALAQARHGQRIIALICRNPLRRKRP